MKIPQSDLGSPEAQYDVYLTHPHGQVAVFAQFHNGRNFAVPLKWAGGQIGRKVARNCKNIVQQCKLASVCVVENNFVFKGEELASLIKIQLELRGEIGNGKCYKIVKSYLFYWLQTV